MLLTTQGRSLSLLLLGSHFSLFSIEVFGHVTEVLLVGKGSALRLVLRSFLEATSDLLVTRLDRGVSPPDLAEQLQVFSVN